MGNWVRTNYRKIPSIAFDEDKITASTIAASAITGSLMPSTADLFSKVIVRGSLTTSCSAAGVINIEHGLSAAPVYAVGCLVGTSGATIKPHTRTVTLQGIGATYLTFLVASAGGLDLPNASVVTMLYAAHL